MNTEKPTMMDDGDDGDYGDDGNDSHGKCLKLKCNEVED